MNLMKKYEELMRKCIEEASKYRFEVMPNPMVAAIIYDEKNDSEIALGVHKKYGEHHAERDAILNNQECDFSDKTLIVNLEPCSHSGKTPPCADLIIEKGFKKVVIGMLDPNPLVSGKGILKLQNAGIEVIIDVLKQECEELNKVFIKNITTKMPFVTIKTATTLDSKIATVTSESKWISDETSRQFVQNLRTQHSAILSGSGTVLADNPALTCRIDGARNPARIIIDRQGKISFDYKVFHDNNTKIFLATSNMDRIFPDNVTAIPFSNFNSLFLKLYEHGICSILVETGKATLSAIVKQGLADEIYKFMAPKIFGTGLDFVGEIGVFKINECVNLEFIETKKLNNDILIRAKFINN